MIAIKFLIGRSLNDLVGNKVKWAYGHSHFTLYRIGELRVHVEHAAPCWAFFYLLMVFIAIFILLWRGYCPESGRLCGGAAVMLAVDDTEPANVNVEVVFRGRLRI